MSAVAELTDALISSGMSAGDAAKMIARVAVELNSKSPTKAALRTRKWREKKASQTVTERHAVTPPESKPAPSPSVTERHKPSPGDAAYISTLPSSSPEEEIKEGRKREGASAKKASRLPDDWQPSKDDIDYALGKGMRFDRICTVGEKFKNHWLTKPGKGATALDWHRKWCTWVLNELDWNGGGPNGRGPNQHRTGGFASNRIDHAFGESDGGRTDYVEGEPSTDLRPRH